MTALEWLQIALSLFALMLFAVFVVMSTLDPENSRWPLMAVGSLLLTAIIQLIFHYGKKGD